MKISKEQFLDNVKYHASMISFWAGKEVKQSAADVDVSLDPELNSIHQDALHKFREASRAMQLLGEACKKKLEQL